MRWRSGVALILAFCLAAYLLLRPGPPQVAPDDQIAQAVGGFEWSVDAPWFGGFSGLEVSSDGATFTAITDRSHVVSGTLNRASGQLVGATVGWSAPILDIGGGKMTGNRVDSEGLAISPDGTSYVSFELLHRVFVYKGLDTNPFWASYHPSFADMVRNGGMEALAIDTSGRLFAFTEAVVDDAGGTPLYRFEGGTWSQPFSIKRLGEFKPVGADFGPDGRLYLLEREFFPFGFRSRVRALTLAEDHVRADQVLLETSVGQHGNLEGIAVWQDTAGNTRLVMIGDDNFLPVQKTEIVEYILTE